jgi:AsmA protein
MRRLLLILAALTGLAFAGIAGAAFWFLSRFDARAEIVRRVEAATGRDFAITGPVSIAVWPAIGFRGEGAALAGVQGGAPQLLEAKEIVIGVALQPLLRERRLEVTQFVLVEPRLTLEVDTQGRPNWILKPVSAAPTPPSGAPAPARPVTEVRLAGARIVDGEVNYTNAKTGSRYLLGSMNLKADMAGLDAPLAIEGAVDYRGKRFDLDLEVARTRALMTGQSTQVDLKLESDVVAATFGGAIQVATGGVEGDIVASGPSLRNLAAWAGGPLGAGYGLETFALAGKLTVGPRRFAFENAGLQIDAIKARGDFVLEQGPRAPLLSGRLEIADESFDPLKAGSGKPSAQRMLLDLNPYLGARPADAATADPAAVQPTAVEVASLQPVNVAAPGWSEAKLNFGWMKTLNTNLELTTGPLKINSVTVDSALLSLTMLDGYLSASLLDMRLYGGQGTSRLEIDARQPEIVVRSEIAAQNLRAQDFFRDAFGFTNIEGTAKVEWGLASRGTTQKSMMRTLEGTGSVAFANGALNGVDLGGVAKTIRNALRQELVSRTARTPFTVMGASFRATGGVMATQDLKLEAADAKISAIGTIDVGARSMDMRMVPRLGVMALAVPFRISGPWGRFGYASDFLGRARAEVENKARAVFAKAPKPPGRS